MTILLHPMGYPLDETPAYYKVVLAAAGGLHLLPEHRITDEEIPLCGSRARRWAARFGHTTVADFVPDGCEGCRAEALARQTR